MTPSFGINRDFVLSLAVITLLLSVGLSLRNAPFTPDEPREFDISWNMLHQPNKAVPLLAGEAFCEKPPLTYWAAAASMFVFGPTVESARLPNLLWSMLTAFCLLSWIGSVVLNPLRNRALVFTALVCGSTLLLLRVQLWLATDAPLVATTAISLLGLWRGLHAATTRDRLLGYGLLHVGLIGAFFAKNLLGWIVPLATFAGVILWERRWRELLRWELYVGLLLQFALITPWIWSVAHYPDGARLLRIFFIDNTLGRFLPIATEEQYQYGHRNHIGKYFIELPYYLLPWTFAALAALRWSYKTLRHRAPVENAIARTQMNAIRFALLTLLPGLILLSLSKTARDVYLAPEMLGFTMLLGLWFGIGVRPEGKFDHICLKLTVITCIALGLLLMILSLAIPALQSQWQFSNTAIIAAMVTVMITLRALTLWRTQWPALGSLFSAWGIFVVGVVLASSVLLPSMDASQDLRPTVRAFATDFRSRPIGALRDDETIRAYLDFGAGVQVANFKTLDAAASWLHEDAARVLVIELQTDHITPSAREQLKSWHASWENIAPADINDSALTLQAQGFKLLSKHEIIGGRTYGVLAAAQ